MISTISDGDSIARQATKAISQGFPGVAHCGNDSATALVCAICSPKFSDIFSSRPCQFRVDARRLQASLARCLAVEPVSVPLSVFSVDEDEASLEPPDGPHVSKSLTASDVIRQSLPPSINPRKRPSASRLRT